MHDLPDPYFPPSAPIQGVVGGPEAFDLRLFIRWEKLRLLYNATLAAETVALVLVAMPIRAAIAGRPPFWIALIVYAVLANICFCVGPVLDGYARLVGRGHKVASALIFAAGTGFAMCCVLFVLMLDPFGPGPD